MSSNEMSKMIASNEFSKMLGDGVNVIKYSELEKYTDINQVIPEQKGYRILLIETKQNTGHYCCLLKYSDQYFEYFDSYGLYPDQEFSFIPQQMQQILDEKVHIMSQLLNKLKSEGGNWTYNKMKLQKMANGVNTCGRWVSSMCYFFKQGYNLKQFQQYFVNWKKETGVSFDTLICAFTKVLD